MCPGDWVSLDVTPHTTADVEFPYYVALDHLTSYAHMGRAVVTCHESCTCESEISFS